MGDLYIRDVMAFAETHKQARAVYERLPSGFFQRSLLRDWAYHNQVFAGHARARQASMDLYGRMGGNHLGDRGACGEEKK